MLSPHRTNTVRLHSGLLSVFTGWLVEWFCLVVEAGEAALGSIWSPGPLLVRAGGGGIPSQGLICHCAAGLYDLMGNVWEWTASQYQAADQDMRVLRGASWIDTADGSANHRARVTTR